MTDRESAGMTGFEARLAAALREYSTEAVQPFDARAIAEKALGTPATQGFRRWGSRNGPMSNQLKLALAGAAVLILSVAAAGLYFDRSRVVVGPEPSMTTRPTQTADATPVVTPSADATATPSSMLPTRPPDAFVAAASVREGVEDLGYFCGAANPEMQWTLCAPDGHLRGAGAAPTAYVRLILGEYASAAQTHRLLGVHVRSENSDGSDPLMRALEEFDGVIDLAMDPALAESAKSWVHERIGRSTGRKGESTRIGTVELNLAASPTYKFLAISLVGTRADWESKRPYVAAEPLRDHLIRLGYRCPPPSTATTIRCWRGDERNGDHADLYLAEFDDRARTHRVSRVDWQWQSEHDSELTTEARAKEREEFGPFIALALEPRHADRVREYALTAWRPAVVVGPVLMRIIDGPRDVRGIDIDFDW